MVLDENDNDPTFENDNYVVSESQAQEAKLCQVGDDDEGLKLEED